jgi:hypothetical protein
MVPSKVPNRVPLDELYRRFDQAACDHPNVDAVVVYRPDLRSQEAERWAQGLYFNPAETASDNFAGDVSIQTRFHYAATRRSMNWDLWIPPSEKSIEQLGGQI